ncbi:MAG: IS3 family transposase [Bacteroidales bacterium]|nr:IS3 family transposase [Bacteroidales bacterium]
MKYIFISENKGRFKVGRMCSVLDVSCSGYYSWLKRPESKRSRENRKLAAQIKVIHMDKYKKVYGSPRVYKEMDEKGISCSPNRVARVIKKEGIIVPRKYKATTNSKHNFPVAPNPLKQNFNVKEPNKVLVADIAYIETFEGWLYLATVMGLGSRRIKGYAMNDRMTQELTLNALNMAIINHSETEGIIHHSDRGSQYACNAYQKLLKDNGLLCSMSRKGNC